MKGLIKYFIRYPFAGNLLMVALMIFGYFGMKSLRSTFFPEFESNIIQVQAVYPGASPAEIEQGVVLKIEDQLDGLIGIDRITSKSTENLGVVTIEVNTDYETEIILQDVKNAVDRISSFPAGMEPPSTFILERPAPAISYTLSGNVTLKELKNIARRVEDDLKQLEGISMVDLEGFPSEEIEISVDEAGLRKYGLVIDQVANAVKRDNIELTGGTVKTEKESILIRARNKKYTGSEIENAVVSALPNGKIIRVKDIAIVRDGWVDEPVRRWLSEGEGSDETCIVVNVNYTINEDILGIVEQVNAYFEKFNSKTNNVKAKILSDRSKILRERQNLLVENGTVGFVLVLLFLSLFLHPRLAFWVALGIPISFAGMFVVAGIYGISINVISLFGMIIVVGILVDDAIVISENIYQHYENGKPAIKAAVDGALEVVPSVFSAILTTVIAFSLFFQLDGRMGDFFVDMGFVVIFTLIFSLVEGVFILPAHVAHSKALSEEGKEGKVQKMINFFTSKLEGFKNRFYKPVLFFSIKNPIFILVSAVGIFAISINFISNGYLKFSPFPHIYSDYLDVKIEMNPGTNESVTEEWVDYVQEKVWQVNEEIKTENNESVIVSVEKKLEASGAEGGLKIILTPSEERPNFSSSVIGSRIFKAVGTIPNVKSFSAKEAGPFGRPLSVALFSSNDVVLDKAKEEFIFRVNQMGKMKNIEASDQKGLQELQISLKDNAYALGLSYAQIVGEVRKAFFGQEVQRLQRGLDEVKIWVRYDKNSRKTISDLENMQLTINNQIYYLKDLVNIDQGTGVVKIEHIDGMKSILVEADIIDVVKTSSNDVVTFVKDSIIPVLENKYPEVDYSFEGQQRDLGKTAKSAKFAGPIVLILMIISVLITFRSVSQTVAVFLSALLGFAGVVFGHLIMGHQLSILSMFGMIALLGVMVNDSLVLIGAFNNNLKKGMAFNEALTKAALSRFRPIVLTTVTTVAGLGPLLFETSMQAQFLIPMAISIAYGLLWATILTLVVLPVMLLSFNYINWSRVWLIKGVWKKREEVEPAVKEIEFEQMNLD